MDRTLSKGKKISKKAINKMLMAFDGDPVGIRTLDLLIRSQSLYPAELPSHVGMKGELHSIFVAGAEGIEPSTNGFGDHYSTS